MNIYCLDLILGKPERNYCAKGNLRCINSSIKSIPKTKEKWYLFLSRSKLSMVWRCHGIPRVYCYHFSFELTVRKDTWMRLTSITDIVFLFERSILKVTWSQICSTFLLNNYGAHWKYYFERYPAVEQFKDTDQHSYVLNISSKLW